MRAAGPCRMTPARQAALDRDMPTVNPWLLRYAPEPRAEMRVLCFPCAGMGASMYRPWASMLPPGVELCAVQPPGREGRFRDEAFTRVPDLVAAAHDALLPYLDRPFALFGHSLGALIAFEMARRWEAGGGKGLRHLFVSARRAPHLPPRRAPIAHLAPDAFVAEIRRRYNGIPDEVLRHADLMELLLPALRADITMLEGYAYGAGAPLACPITAYGGADDAEATAEEVEAWREYTRAPFRQRIFPGGHFFVKASQAALLCDVSQALAGAARERL